jgi:hypothetical protein
MLGKNTDGAAAGIWQIAIGEGVATTQTKSMAIGRSGGILLHGEFATAGQTSLGVNLGNTWTAPSATLHVKGGGNSHSTVALLIQDSDDVQIMKLTNDGDNIAIGLNALDTVTEGSGIDNIAIGVSAGTAITTADDNICIGNSAGAAITSHGRSIFIGSDCGTAFTGSNAGTVGIGYNAMSGLTTGSYNTAMGYSAGAATANHSYNTYIGYQAGRQIQDDGNTALGYQALEGGAANTTAANNTGIGKDALTAITTGDNNLALGYQCGDNLTTGSNNVFIGYDVAASAVDVDNELRIGNGSTIPISANMSTGAVTINGAYTLPTAVTGSNDYVLTAQTDGSTAWAAASGGGLSNYIETGTSNFGAGSGCLDSISATNGNYNTGIGVNAGTAVSTGDQNCIIGWDAAPYLSTGGLNVVIGAQTAKSSNATDFTECVIIGQGAAMYLDGGVSGCVYVGRDCALGGTNSTGDNNVGVGSNALRSQTTGNYNAAVGFQAGYSTTTGYQNSLLGYAAGYGITTGYFNCVVGRCEDLSEGIGNTLIGHNYGTTSITTGDYNTIVGHQALAAPTINNQIAIGYQAAVTAQYGIAIGDNVSAGGDDCVIGKNGNIITVDFDTDGTWSQSSDLRKKNVIGEDSLGLDFINALTTKTYKWKPASEHPDEWKHYTLDDEGNKVYTEMNTDTVMHGLIAQEVKAALDAAGCSTFGGWSEDANGQQQISKSQFVIPLIKAVKELTARVVALENK